MESRAKGPIILTGYPDLENAIRAVQDQLDGYLTKPADIEKLVVKVRLGTLRPPICLAAVRIEKGPESLESVKKDPLLRKARLKESERVDAMITRLRKGQGDPKQFLAAVARMLTRKRSKGVNPQPSTSWLALQLWLPRGLATAILIAKSAWVKLPAALVVLGLWFQRGAAMDRCPNPQ